MDDQRYEDAFRTAATHITTQPRPHANDLLVDAVMARTAAIRPHRGSIRPLRWLAAAAAVVVVAGLAWFVARPGLPVAGVPAVVPSPSATTGQANLTLVFDVDASLPYQDATFEVRRENQDLTITVKATKDGRKTTTLGTFHARADAVWSTEVDDHLQLALLPGFADQVTSLAGSLVHSQWLPGIGMTAIAVEHDTPHPNQALIWRDNDGQIHNSLGNTLPSATLTAGPASLVVFEDSQLGVWGYLDPRNDDRHTATLDTEPVGTIRGLSATGEGRYFTDATWISVLPAGATNPRLDTKSGATWDAAPIGDTGRIAILIHTGRVKAGRTGINTITYTDRDGMTQSFTP